MTHYFLSSHVYPCAIDDGAILLDARRNRYLGISAGAWRIISRTVALAPANDPIDDAAVAEEGDSRAEMQELLRAGILTTRATDGKSQCEQPAVAEDSLAANSVQVNPSINIGHVARFWLAFLMARIQLRFLRIEAIVNRLARDGRRLNDRTACPSVAQLRLHIERFRRLRLWAYSAAGVCLVDSLVLVEYLRRSGVPSTLVIGVKTKPFAAHAWVQCGSLVVNDKFERVRQYTPILGA
jgi:transglutaminase superfamily protein